MIEHIVALFVEPEHLTSNGLVNGDREDQAADPEDDHHVVQHTRALPEPVAPIGVGDLRQLLKLLHLLLTSLRVIVLEILVCA